MYRTTTRERTFEKKKFNEFKRRSFYDMQVNLGFVSDLLFSDMVTNALFLSWTQRQGRSSTLVKLPWWASATSPTCRPCSRASEATPIHALHVPDMQDILHRALDTVASIALVCLCEQSIQCIFASFMFYSVWWYLHSKCLVINASKRRSYIKNKYHDMSMFIILNGRRAQTDPGLPSTWQPLSAPGNRQSLEITMINV